MSNRRKLRPPAPGLHGDYTGTCVACLRPTDTALATVGEAEWHIAFLINLGVPNDQAAIMIQSSTGADPGMVVSGRSTSMFQVCAACAAAAGFPKPALAIPGADLPAIRQME